MAREGVCGLIGYVSHFLINRILGLKISFVYSQEMGIPFNNLICASNENNILTDFFQSGSYDMSKRCIQQTISPSIDILKSSNLERLLYHVTGSRGRVVAELMRSLEENRQFQVCSCNVMTH